MNYDRDFIQISDQVVCITLYPDVLSARKPVIVSVLFFIFARSMWLRENLDFIVDDMANRTIVLAL